MLLPDDLEPRTQIQRYNLEIIRLLEEINSKLSPVTVQEEKPEEPKPKRTRKKTRGVDNVP